MIDWQAIAGRISAETQLQFRISSLSEVGGGCINRAFRVDGTDGRLFFVKVNSPDKLAMFDAEIAGLQLIAATNTLPAPLPIVHGVAGNHSFIVLEHLQLENRGDYALLGRQLAALHRNEGARFGYASDNFIGSSPQPNLWADDWIAFWREQRLGFQLRLAAQRGFGGSLQKYGTKLMDSLPELFDGYRPRPSLLHGDLWGGNCAFLASGNPVTFDPAAYYGDREADLAMTELFGGFAPDFYAAYRAAYPLHDGYRKRRQLYNVYHILNHANLFGGGYARQAEQMIDDILNDL
ncbi:MAG: fructosamine kinase family protein [Gallionella sp.]